jgi:hypothetical protein
LTADNSVSQYSNANDMRVTQDLNSFGEIIAHAQCSVDEKKNIYSVWPGLDINACPIAVKTDAGQVNLVSRMSYLLKVIFYDKNVLLCHFYRHKLRK